jgi:hypothetical protein
VDTWWYSWRGRCFDVACWFDLVGTAARPASIRQPVVWQQLSGSGGKYLLCDRLWHNGGFAAVTTPQTINSPTWPARDIDGATAGKGVFLGLEYNATGAANAPVITVSYNNSAGASGRVGVNAFATAASSPQCSFYPIGLQAGDLGVQSVQTLTFSLVPTANSCNLVAYRVIASLEITGSYVGSSIDLVTGGMPQIWNDSVLFPIFIPAQAAAVNLTGGYTVTQG